MIKFTLKIYKIKIKKNYSSKLGLSVQVSRLSPPRRFRRLHPTGWRLGAAAASTTVPAGDKRSITHKIFRGVTAAVAPNRLL
jgi:hypothetical protein